MTNAKQIIAERLRMAREHAGLSQGQVARLFDYHRPTISEIEAGRRRVSGDELARFAEIYEVSIEWITDSEQMIDPRVQLAARELSKLKPDDLDRVLRVIASLRGPRTPRS
jgi:transcriptional regulator with XRE-family HTH domain